MTTAQDLIHAAQNNAGVPAHRKDKPLDYAFIDANALEGFCNKYGITPPEVIARFLAVDPETFDDDKKIVLMREQARMGIDVVKAYMPKDVQVSGKDGGAIPLVIKADDAGIL